MSRSPTTARCSNTSRSSFAAARSSRSRAERLRQDDDREARRRAARAAGGRVCAAVALRCCCRIQAAISSASAPTTRSRSARSQPRARGARRGRPRRLGSAPPARPLDGRARTARARDVLVAEPDLLVLDEPTRGVDPERRQELAALLRAQAAGRATLVVTNDRVVRACGRRPRDRARRRAGARACVASSSSRCRVRRRGVRDARVRTRALPCCGGAACGCGGVARRRSRLGEGDRGDRDACRGGRGRPRPFAPVPDVQPVTDLAVISGVALGASRRRRRRGDRSVRVEFLPRPGVLDAVADARVGRLRRGGCAARTAAASPHLARCRVLPARLRVRLRARFLELVRIRAAHVGVVHRAPGCGSAVRRRARERESCARVSGGPELRRMLERYGKRLKTEIVWA